MKYFFDELLFNKFLYILRSTLTIFYVIKTHNRGLSFISYSFLGHNRVESPSNRNRFEKDDSDGMRRINTNKCRRAAADFFQRALCVFNTNTSVTHTFPRMVSKIKFKSISAISKPFSPQDETREIYGAKNGEKSLDHNNSALFGQTKSKLYFTVEHEKNHRKISKPVHAY